jgi:hypothetical protein
MRRNDGPSKRLKRQNSENNYQKFKVMHDLKRDERVTNSKIYQILSRKERTTQTLLELNKALESEVNLSFLNVTDPALDGSFLHYVTSTAQANDE